MTLKKLDPSAFLASLGFSGEPSLRRTVEEEVQDVLATRGYLSTVVVELRWGRLLLSAPPHEAALLRMDMDVVLSALSERVPGVITHLAVRSLKPTPL